MKKLIILLLTLTTTFSYGQQTAAPISDVLFNLLGGYSVNTTGNRYQNIDETTPFTGDYNYSQNNPGGSSDAEFGLTSLSDPVSAIDHFLKIYTFQIDEDSGSHPQTANNSGSATTCAWELRQGSTPIIIASGTINPATAGDLDYTLSAAEANAITDYTDLRVYVSPNGGGGNPANRRGVAIYYISFEVPNAGTPPSRRIMTINK